MVASIRYTKTHSVGEDTPWSSDNKPVFSKKRSQRKIFRKIQLLICITALFFGECRHALGWLARFVRARRPLCLFSSRFVCCLRAVLLSSLHSIPSSHRHRPPILIHPSSYSYNHQSKQHTHSIVTSRTAWRTSDDGGEPEEAAGVHAAAQ